VVAAAAATAIGGRNPATKVLSDPKKSCSQRYYPARYLSCPLHYSHHLPSRRALLTPVDHGETEAHQTWEFPQYNEAVLPRFRVVRFHSDLEAPEAPPIDWPRWPSHHDGSSNSCFRSSFIPLVKMLCKRKPTHLPNPLDVAVNKSPQSTTSIYIASQISILILIFSSNMLYACFLLRSCKEPANPFVDVPDQRKPCRCP
jgi:hypothetical protein